MSKIITHASLFSGIGGPEVAAAMLGWKNAFHCEINPFGRSVLEYWFPESVSYEDITKTNFEQWRGRIDVLTGGFPCQPFSYAGRRGGREDERYLWPQMLRAIDEIRPTWVVGENVAGIITMVEGGVLTDLGGEVSLFQEGDDLHRYALEQSFTIERICRDLERAGYSVQPMLIPAAAVGAPHRRDRIFIVAHVTDADCGDDLRGSGKYEGERAERNGYKNGTKYGSLESQIKYDPRLTKMLPTPIAGDWKGQKKGEGKGPETMLCGVVETSFKNMLPTPTARDEKNPSSPDGKRIMRKREQGWTIELSDLAPMGLLPTPTAIEGVKWTNTYNPKSQMGQSLSAMAGSGLLPTPLAHDAIGRTNPGVVKEKSGCVYVETLPDTIHRMIGGDSSPKSGGPTFRLSPLFTEEMMGFPFLWTTLPFLRQDGEPKALKPTEMP